MSKYLLYKPLKCYRVNKNSTVIFGWVIEIYSGCFLTHFVRGLIPGGALFLHLIQLPRRNAVPDSSTTSGGIFFGEKSAIPFHHLPELQINPCPGRQIN